MSHNSVYVKGSTYILGQCNNMQSITLNHLPLTASQRGWDIWNALAHYVTVGIINKT